MLSIVACLLLIQILLKVLLVMDYVAGGAILESALVQPQDRLTEGAARKYMRDVLLVRVCMVACGYVCSCQREVVWLDVLSLCCVCNLTCTTMLSTPPTEHSEYGGTLRIVDHCICNMEEH